MCSDKMVWIFVYGTLKTGGKLDRKLSTYTKAATVTGVTMYHYSRFPYPFAKVDGSANRVKGELQLIPADKIWLLDRIEGSNFSRVPIITDCGTPCQIYESKVIPFYAIDSIKEKFDQHA